MTDFPRGLDRFIAYAMAPNERGFCGPQDRSLVRDHLRGGDGSAADGPAVRRVAAAFAGPLPYLQVISRAAGIDDVFDRQVVEAYWVGNDLLDLVDPHECADALLTAFHGQPTVDPRRIRATRDGALPHHAYHVLVTYPWIDLVAVHGRTALSPLDVCRIRTGVVEAVGEQTVVSSRHLVLGVDGIEVGAAASDVVRPIDHPGDPLTVGDRVSLHYDLLCERLTDAQADGMDARTATVVDLVNRCLLGRRDG